MYRSVIHKPNWIYARTVLVLGEMCLMRRMKHIFLEPLNPQLTRERVESRGGRESDAQREIYLTSASPPSFGPGDSQEGRGRSSCAPSAQDKRTCRFNLHFESVTCPVRAAPGRAISGRRPSPEVPWPYGWSNSSPLQARSACAPQGFARTVFVLRKHGAKQVSQPPHADACSGRQLNAQEANRTAKT